MNHTLARLDAAECDLLLHHTSRDLLNGHGDARKTLAICRRRIECVRALLERMPVTVDNAKRGHDLEEFEERVRGMEGYMRAQLGTSFVVIQGGRK